MATSTGVRRRRDARRTAREDRRDARRDRERRRGRTGTRLAALTLALLVLPACKRPPETLPDVARHETVALYRASLQTDRPRPRRFRLLLFAARPDRFHGEVVGPLGGTAWILDAGGGRLAVTDARAGEAWVGDDDGRLLAEWIGVRLAAGDLVRALFDGVAPTGWTLTREAHDASPFPAALEISDGRSELRLELKALRPLEGPADALGRGRPPDGVRVHALDVFPAERVDEELR